MRSLPRRTPDEVRTRLRVAAKDSGGRVPRGNTERYWLLAWCNVLTGTGWRTHADAAQQLRLLNADACGHACRNWHAILDMEMLTYVDTPLFAAFCQSLPSTLNVLVSGPPVRTCVGTRWRQVEFAGLRPGGQPWLGFRPAPAYWSLEWGDGNYRYYPRWRTLVDDSGIEELMHWFFYEVTSQTHRNHPAMSLACGALWSKCPRTIALRLVPALHTFMTGLVARIERTQAHGQHQ